MTLPLTSLLDRYREQREVAEATFRWLVLVANRFSRHLRHDATLSDLTDDVVNAWVASMLSDSDLARSTIKGYRRGLLILWRFAVDEGLVDRSPGRLKKLKVPKKLPVAWTLDEMRRLLEAASRLPGRTQQDRFSRRLFTVALISVTWDSGLRLRDLLRLQWSDFNAKGAGAIVQHKTGNPVHFQLSRDSLIALEAIRRPRRKLVFGDSTTRKSIQIAIRMAVESAGLQGSIHKIRKSGASAVESVSAGSAMAYLGHKTHGLDAAHYLDPRIVQRERKAPPSLGVAEFCQRGQFGQTAPKLVESEPAQLQQGESQPIAAAPEAPPAMLPEDVPTFAPPMMDLLTEFLGTVEILATSPDYRVNLLTYIRSAIEDCDFHTTDDLAGEKLVAWLRWRIEDGLSAARASWCRYSLMRFFKWVAAQGAADKATECLGALAAATDLHADKPANNQSAKRRRAALRTE